jgi:hypothetical protein
MSFTGSEDHSITLADASKFTGNYRESMILGGYFGKDAISKIIDQDGCVGIRIYHALDDDRKPQFVLVGVDSDEKDMEEGELAERAILCPPQCGPIGSLNS